MCFSILLMCNFTHSNTHSIYHEFLVVFRHTKFPSNCVLCEYQGSFLPWVGKQYSCHVNINKAVQRRYMVLEFSLNILYIFHEYFFLKQDLPRVFWVFENFVLSFTILTSYWCPKNPTRMT